MGYRGHTIKIGTLLSDHGGERQKRHERLLAELYTDILLVLMRNPEYGELHPELFSLPDED